MDQIHNAMQKEMTRKEFLTTLGFGLASLLGFASVIRLLTGKAQHSSSVQRGYGDNSYGG